jgi:transposase-like protein
MLSEALGIKSISKDQVSRICKELDTQVHAFRTRRLDGEFPYVFLDATFEKVREKHSVVVDQSVRAETASEPYRLPVFTGRRIF